MPLRIFALLTVLLGTSIALAGDRLMVSAAASLKEALTDIAGKFEAETGIGVDLNMGASGQLAAQIDAGAPVDVLVSAGEGPVRQLEKNSKIGSPRAITGNRVVLIVPAEKTAAEPGGKSDISSFESLGGESLKRLAIGRPKVVPAGDYAMQVLDHLALATKVKDKLVYGQNVRQVLDYVSRGEVDAGIVYATDATEAGAAVRVVATAEESWHDPVRYLAAVVKGGKEIPAGKFVEYLNGAVAQGVLHAHGFTAAFTAAPAPNSGGGK